MYNFTFRKTSWLFILVLSLVVLSACTFSKGNTMTEVVFQEKKDINSLQEYVLEAKKLANESIGPEAQLKYLTFSYNKEGDYISYTAIFLGNDHFSNNITKNLQVTYNSSYSLIESTSALGWQSHEMDTIINNNELIGIQCSLHEDCERIALVWTPKEAIDINDLSISVQDLFDNYKRSSNTQNQLGIIVKSDGVLLGLWGEYRFKPKTGEVALLADINEDKWFAASKSEPEPFDNTTISTATNTANSNFNNDSDLDGLTDLQEIGYGTRRFDKDSDSDGFSDFDEINNGYNPNGSGKLMPDNCSGDQNGLSDDCYLKLSIAAKNNSYCQQISARDRAAACIASVEMIKGNQYFCDSLEDEYPDSYLSCMDAREEMEADLSPPVKKDRDVLTVSNIKQIQIALEMYYMSMGSYPTSITAGNPIASDMGIHLREVPLGEVGRTVVCATNYQYEYTFINERDYSLSYCIEDNSVIGEEFSIGVHLASPRGMGIDTDIDY